MPKVITLCIPGAPRTKKTSNRVIRARGKVRVLPSESYSAWFADVVTFRPLIHAELRRAGVQLPLTGPVHVCATIYRAQRSGDATGFYQAIGDAIQEKRGGLGLIADDAQIVHWDGSRLEVDREYPRVELEITETAVLPSLEIKRASFCVRVAEVVSG